MNIDNRRDYFRVDILIPVQWSVLSQAEADLVKKGAGDTLLNRNSLKGPLDGATEKAPHLKDHQVYQSLQSLNNKLDYVIDMMISNSFEGHIWDRITEISASGLKFRTSEQIDKGIFLKMGILLPGTSYVQVELISETLRVEKIDNGYIVAANIVSIDEDDRELIIKIIFQKQRIDIRRFKTCQENAGND